MSVLCWGRGGLRQKHRFLLSSRLRPCSSGSTWPRWLLFGEPQIVSAASHRSTHSQLSICSSSPISFKSVFSSSKYCASQAQRWTGLSQLVMSSPLTQLGSHGIVFVDPSAPVTSTNSSPTIAFSHSASADTEAEYDRLRGLARQEHDKRASCFDRVGSSLPTSARRMVSDNVFIGA